jgi:nickel/cobalt transporter (NicO) family protein
MSRFAHRVAALAVLAAVLLAAGATRAAAHPLGNFTVSTYSGLRVGPDRLEVDYVLDMAEIPTFQARQAVDTDHDGMVTAAEAAAWRDRECPRLARDLLATADGRALPLGVTGSALSFPKGAADLETLRLECALTAPLPAGPAAGRSLTYTDNTQQGRVGWHEITAVGDRTTIDADVPATSASARLTAYPEDQLSSPLDQRTASLHTHPGGSARATPAPEVGNGVPGTVTRGGVDRVMAAFTALVGGRSRSPGLVVVALLVAVGLGAAHALAPGHGKTVMAAYLVGLRGTPRQAAAIGATVTVTHTAGVLVLGAVLSSSRAVASERLYPWLGLASGLLLAAVGLGLLVRARPAHHHHHHDHDHPHAHDHDHSRPLGLRGLVTLGLAGGLVPSPSAVVVLLGGIALGRAWFGVALVLAYGVGMAATLTGIGLLLARLRARMDRRLQLPAGSLLARAGRLLPAVTASVIVVVGLALAASGAAQL